MGDNDLELCPECQVKRMMLKNRQRVSAFKPCKWCQRYGLDSLEITHFRLKREEYQDTVKWNEFSKTEKGRYIELDNGGRTIKSTGPLPKQPCPICTGKGSNPDYKCPFTPYCVGGKVVDPQWNTTCAKQWISSSGRAIGTIQVLSDQVVWVGIITQDQHAQWDMNGRLDFGCPDGGSCWFYNNLEGSICQFWGGSFSLFWKSLQEVKKGDTITVAMKDGQLTFKVNGVPQGAPIDLPPDTKVKMAVSTLSSGGAEACFRSNPWNY